TTFSAMRCRLGSSATFASGSDCVCGCAPTSTTNSRLALGSPVADAARCVVVAFAGLIGGLIAGDHNELTTERTTITLAAIIVLSLQPVRTNDDDPTATLGSVASTLLRTAARIGPGVSIMP